MRISCSLVAKCAIYSESLDNESDLEVLADKLHAFAQLVEICGMRLLNADDLAKVCAVVQSQMGNYEERLADLRKVCCSIRKHVLPIFRFRAAPKMSLMRT